MSMFLQTIVDVLVVAMPLFYGVVVFLYARSFFTGNSAAERWKSPVLKMTVILHLVYILARTAAFDHPPITTVYEIMTILAACIAVGYLYIEVRTHARNTGFFILLLAFVFQLASSLFIKDLVEIDPVLRSRLLGFHVSATLLGYTGISLSAAYGFLYLMLYHEIKSSRFGIIYQRLPNLEMLETMSTNSEFFGFLTLSVGIAIGFFWLPLAFDNVSYWDPKLIGTLFIWVLYLIGIVAKRRFGLQGRKMMIVSLVGFGFVFLSMTLINFGLSGFHKFH